MLRSWAWDRCTGEAGDAYWGAPPSLLTAHRRYQGDAMTIAPPEISDPLAREAPHATAATEVGLNDNAVCRIGHGIIVQIVDA